MRQPSSEELSKIGEPVEIGGLRYTVLEVLDVSEAYQYIFGDSFPQVPIIRARVSVENTGYEDGLDFHAGYTSSKVRDSNGYEYDSEVNWANFEETNLEKGQSITFEVDFLLREDASDLVLIFEDIFDEIQYKIALDQSS